MIDDDSIDLEALEEMFAPADTSNLDNPDEALIIDLTDLIADENGIVQIADSEFPITLMTDVNIVDQFTDGDNANPTYHYQFANDVTVMSEAEINVVMLGD